jgi:V-type H+-transporting ATPase subunit a
MSLLIVIKWCTTWVNTHDAPSLLEMMTNFFLAPGVITGTPLYAGQAGIQVLLLLVAFSMVPVLLCVIPYMEKKHHEEKLKNKGRHQHHRGHHSKEGEDEEEEEEEHFDFSEIVIHQVIHTIEFVLGAVSNTASYLRLWALSLAHAQLSDVFWNFAFMMTVGLDSGSGIFVFVGFAVWICATIGVLLGMESLGAFLHALRLHWVEFQSKFYYGDGIPFLPFEIASIS